MFRSIGHGVDDLGGHETAGIWGGLAERTCSQSRPWHPTHTLLKQPHPPRLGGWPWATICASGASAGA